MRKGGVLNLWQIREEVKNLRVQVRRPPDPLAGKPYRLQTRFDLSSLTDPVTKGGLRDLSNLLGGTRAEFHAKHGRKEEAINVFVFSLKHFIHA